MCLEDSFVTMSEIVCFWPKKVSHAGQGSSKTNIFYGQVRMYSTIDILPLRIMAIKVTIIIQNSWADFMISPQSVALLIFFGPG